MTGIKCMGKARHRVLTKPFSCSLRWSIIDGRFKYVHLLCAAARELAFNFKDAIAGNCEARFQGVNR
jgi:hypothetical protein